jgi:hypothetical protein
MRQIMVFVILFISIYTPLSLSQAWDIPSERPTEKGRWLCWNYSGKGSWALEITTAHPLEYFVKDLSDFDSEIHWRVTNEKKFGWSKYKGEVKNVGVFAGRQVWDIFFYLPQDKIPFGKMVLISENNLFRPVVWILADTLVYFASSEIKIVQGVSVLETKCRIDGRGNYYYEDYFIFDEQLKIPVNLRSDSIISAAIEKLLPSGHRIVNGGGFNLESLSYVIPVWKEKDGNSATRGGKIEIKLKLVKDHLIVSKANYFPDYQ